MKPLLLLDLDTTLMKTTMFWHDFAHVLAQESDRLIEKYLVCDSQLNQENYFKPLHYDGIIADYRSAPAITRRAIKSRIALNNYLFEDAKTFIGSLAAIQKSYDVAILTFGQTSYQQFKIDHIPQLARLTTHITQMPKADYIEKNFNDRPHGLLIDDKPDQNLPKKWLEICINRSKELYNTPVMINNRAWQITNLEDVKRIIK